MATRITNDLAHKIGRTLSDAAFEDDLIKEQQRVEDKVWLALNHAYHELDCKAWITEKAKRTKVALIRYLQVYRLDSNGKLEITENYPITQTALYFLSDCFTVHVSMFDGTTYLSDIARSLDRLEQVKGSVRAMQRQVTACAKQARTVEKLIELWPESAEQLAHFLDQPTSITPSLAQLIAQHRPPFLQEKTT